ncbi:MAG: undecaprenyldiphospho-muramoylpentapeptide beta-N-acetylglucosaminyltransferase [Hyphomicrobiales bacterium]|nr:undecaprenyldiphospho-muramoylpentapeptide beta-N-acetylglucosaminyltransferase [Hyphomicrobiales bacterium]
MSSGDLVVLAAGGTGGHLFPAQALADELRRRGCRVELVTDSRAQRYTGNFPADHVHVIASATPRGGSLAGKLQAGLVLARGTLQALGLLRRLRPAIVVGFGGYPTVPPLMAASLLKMPTVLHEQNAVLGAANRALARRVTAIATGFGRLGGSDGRVRAKARDVGNPVRPAVLAAAATQFPAVGEGGLHVLITGGSQGARVFADIMPEALRLMPEAVRARMHIVQQARPEDVARVRDAYAASQTDALVESFFNDLPARMASAHLVVARAGASTVAELAVIGRPAILVPFPHALDQDQAANAAELEKSGAVKVIRQNDFTAPWVAQALEQALDNPLALAQRAQAAKAQGRVDATARLADLVLGVAQKHKLES